MTTHLAAPVTHPAAPVTTHASSLRPRAPPPPRHPESILGWLPSRKETQGGRGKSAPAGDWARTRRAPRENGGDAAVTPASPHLSPPRTQPRRREQLLSPLSRFILGATYWPPQSAESPGLLERLQTKGSTLAGSGARRSRGGRARARARGVARPLRARLCGRSVRSAASSSSSSFPGWPRSPGWTKPAVTRPSDPAATCSRVPRNRLLPGFSPLRPAVFARSADAWILLPEPPLTCPVPWAHSESPPPRASCLISPQGC